jgi:hypothetical protein
MVLGRTILEDEEVDAGERRLHLGARAQRAQEALVVLPGPYAGFIGT